MHDGLLLESTGGYGTSALYQKDLRSGRVIRKQELADHLFGEGLTVVGSRILQLTWREERLLAYELNLQPLASRALSGEGWGLARLGDGGPLVKSDGSSTLKVLDPGSLKMLREITVTEAGRPVALLNELEFAREHLWANIWMSDRVVAVRPSDGQVVGDLDLAALEARIRKRGYRLAEQHVLNGIAYRPDAGTLLVTGKCWPSLFEIRILEGPLSARLGEAPAALGSR